MSINALRLGPLPAMQDRADVMDKDDGFLGK
jgi:hypothetical protein